MTEIPDIDPLVPCDRHGTCEPGYILCRHVVEGAPVGFHLQPLPNCLGQICCTRPVESHDAGDLTFACKACAMELCQSRLPA